MKCLIWRPKNAKTQGKNCLQLNFQPGYCEDVNSVVRQTDKTLNKLKLLGNIVLKNFSNIASLKFEYTVSRLVIS